MWDDGRKDEGEDQEECEVVSVLEHDELVGGQVSQLDLPPRRDDTRMFPDTEPANVGEEKTSLEDSRGFSTSI